MKPILLNTEMVRAVLDGRKTVTRRVVRFPPGLTGSHQTGELGNPDNPLGLMWACGIKRPPYQPDDILYVRETWRETGEIAHPYAYKSDGKEVNLVGECGQVVTFRYRWRPSIHMPKDAARIFLRVTNVRVERLQDIDESEMLQDTGEVICTEGFDKVVPYDEHFKFLLQAMWGRYWDKHIVKMKQEYMWSANPWVWVIEFERTEKG